METQYTTQAEPAVEECLSGMIERVTFHNEDNGFCVLRIRVRGRKDPVTVIGNAVSVTAGEYIECVGQWFNDKRHGIQFKTTQLKVVPPTTVEGIEKYLGSGMVKGIGPHFARKLVKAFGEAVFDIIESEPARLMELEGIGEKRKQCVLDSWSEQKSVREIMVFLQSHGVGCARAVRIYKTYGDRAIEMVRQNPYRLALDIYGVGFKTADALAMRLGIASDSMIRAQAGVCHVLQELCNRGHCAVPHSELVDASVALLEISESIIQQAITIEIEDERMVAESIDGEPCVFLASLYLAETTTAAHLQRLLPGEPPWGEIDIERAIPWVEEKTGLELSDSQRVAVTTVLQRKVAIITGGPGVGKTTVVNSIIRIIGAKRAGIGLCAPTGRAAKRLSETTGREAKTIHRLLEFNPSTRCFNHDQDKPLPFDLVVVDEASMIDITLMYHLIKAIQTNAALLIVGDVDQLPSVGPGAVLGDLIGSQIIPTVRLTEIFRQAADSMIILNAHRINRGEMPLENETSSDFFTIYADTPEEIHDKLLHIVTDRIPRRYHCDPVRDIQVLTPMNRGGLGTRSLNAELQRLLNERSEPRISRFGWTFAPGDKVIQNINNYDKNVFNGDIGVIRQINLEESTLTILYDDRPIEYDFNELDEIALAYATSIHKSQGSEYPIVVIPLSTQHYPMLARNLIYTGITRGKQLVILVGQKRAVGIAVRNYQYAKRLTKLRERLMGALQLGEVT